VPDALWARGTKFLEQLHGIVEQSGVAVSVSGIPPMPFLTFERTDPHYKERRTRFYTECIRRGLFVQPYHHWYINYRHTDEDLAKALDVIRASLVLCKDAA
jgi:glutamate-1-semialdehyde aminotransferase